MNKEELLKYAYDPNMIQRYILKNLDSNNKDIELVDPSNPFTLLLESLSVTASNAITECKSIVRKKYPVLATSEDDLYHHLSDKELLTVQSTPSEVDFYFYINVLDLKLKGYRPHNAQWVETTIPAKSSIEVLGVTLTLLNDIIVKVYDNGNIFAEQQISDIEIAYKNIGVLNSGLIHDANGVPYIVLSTRVKQVSLTSVNLPITPSTGFIKVIPLTSKYYWSEIKYKNNRTNNEYAKLPKVYTDEYIDPLNPSCYVSIYSTDVQFKIPDTYILENRISGTITIDLYETNGKMYLPLSTYNNNDFVLTLKDINKNESAATSPNILIYGKASGILEGGSNGATLEELRNDIINHSTGQIELPITNKQLTKFSKEYGYDIIKVEDVITNRMFIANKPLPIIDSDLIYANQDVYFNKVSLLLSDIVNNKQVTNLTDAFILKSNSVYKISNGICVLLENDELQALQELNGLPLADRCKEKDYFYSPFYYRIKKDYTVTRVNVYDMDNPSVDINRILDKNNNLPFRVNINQIGIIKIENGYRFLFNTVANTEYNNLPLREKGFQVLLRLNNDITDVYFDAEYNDNNGQGYWYVDILTDLNISDHDDFDIKNGNSNIARKRCKFNSKFTILSYIRSNDVVDNTNFLKNELWQDSDNSNISILTKEECTVHYGKELKHLWNNIYSAYTEKKYAKYTENVYKTYKEDVYETDALTGHKFFLRDGELVSNILHRKGEYILDENNLKIIEHHKGDIILDEHGNPVVDLDSGVIRYLDIMLLNYEFYRATSLPYKNYNKVVNDLILKYLTSDLKTMNNNVLEQTNIYYKTNKSLTDVIINVNKMLYNKKAIVSPNVKLYVNDINRSIVNNNYIKTIKPTIGYIISKHLNNKVVNINNIREEILSSLGSDIAAVKLYNIEDSDQLVIYIEDDKNTFTLKKILNLDVNGDLIVEYDINIEVVYI